MRQAPSTRFRREGWLDALARTWPSSGVLGRIRAMLKPAFEATLALGAGGALESSFPGGEVVRVRPSSRNLAWNPDEYHAFRNATRPGGVVIEAGANAGGYSVLFGQWVGPAGRVYAFEPDPRAFAALEDHVRLNGVLGRVIPIASAVGARSGRARLRMAAAGGLSRIVDGAEAGPEIVDVDAVSIDEFCARENVRPSVIKIDVEGVELDVLRGARCTIAAAGQGTSIFVEMHPALWAEAATTARELVHECEGLGLALERLDGAREGLWDVAGVCLRLSRSGR